MEQSEKDKQSQKPNFCIEFQDKIYENSNHIHSREAYGVLLQTVTYDTYSKMRDYSDEQCDTVKDKLEFWKLERIKFKFTANHHSTIPMVFRFEFESDYKTRFDMILSQIDNEIEFLNLLSESEDSGNESFPIPLLTPLQTQQIAYLHEFGVLEFLRKRFKNQSNSTIAHYVSVILGIPHQSIKTAINRLYNGEIDSKNLEIAKKFIADKKNIPVPLPEIKFDKDIEDSEK